MKTLITADLHIHKYRQFDKAGSRLQYAIDQIEWLFETAASIPDCAHIGSRLGEVVDIGKLSLKFITNVK